MRSEFRTTQSGKTFTMNAWVDAENGFGAQVRTNFTCVATDVGGGNFRVTATLQ